MHHRLAHGPAVRRSYTSSIPQDPQEPQDSQDSEVQLPHDDLPIPSLSISDGPSLVKRSSATTCGGNDCEHYASKATSALPIALGVVIPVVIAILILIYLHRRHVVKLRREDRDDKFKSLDFGMGDVETVASRKKKDKKRGKNNKENLDMEEKPHHSRPDKGLSLDMSNPFLLPPGVTGTRDSFHSLQKSATGNDDNKYRHATSFLDRHPGSPVSPVQTSSSHDEPFNNPFTDPSSSSFNLPHAENDDGDRNLLGNAQRMSRSTPPLCNPDEPHDGGVSRNPFMSDQEQENDHQQNLPIATSPGLLTTGEAAGGDNNHRDSHVSNASSVATDIRKSNGYLSYLVRRESPHPGAEEEEHEREKEEQNEQHNLNPANFEFVVSDHSSSTNHPEFPLPPAADNQASTTTTTQSSAAQPPRISLPLSDAGSDYSDGGRRLTDLFEANAENGNKPTQEEQVNPRVESTYDNFRDTRRFTFGLRPLPPEDPSENPEQRANRIRSFYKEYFDPSRPVTEYHEDNHGPEFYGDVFDPVSEIPSTYGLPRPFAEPVGRRAMTPPPRGPPRFQGHSYGDSNFDLPSPRVNSSASNRIASPASFGGGGPRRPIPPPAPLQTLPTPHMLKDDFYMQSIQFAPSGNFRDQREGRADTPTGGLRPFSPSTRPHTPLASPFDELAVVPSPHAMRISGTYNTLDFAPPPRFRTAETNSDAGSIRSNRTGVSAAHMFNIRNGAYRVSRLPSDNVGTKDDMYSNLRPKWDMGR